MECIRDNETKSYFNYIKKKHSLIKVNDPGNIEGEVIIKSIRKYPTWSRGFRYEVDVEFKGSIWGRGSYSHHREKCEHKDFSSLSKIKVYRAIRMKVLNNLKSRLSLFDIQIDRPENITKIKWVG